MPAVLRLLLLHVIALPVLVCVSKRAGVARRTVLLPCCATLMSAVTGRSAVWRCRRAYGYRKRRSQRRNVPPTHRLNYNSSGTLPYNNDATCHSHTTL